MRPCCDDGRESPQDAGGLLQRDALRDIDRRAASLAYCACLALGKQILC